MGLRKLLSGGALLDEQRQIRRTTLEGSIGDAAHGTGDLHLHQARAVLEGDGADGGHTVGNGDLLQIGHGQEGCRGDVVDRGALLKGHFRGDQIGENVVTQHGDPLAHFDSVDLAELVDEGAVAVVVVIAGGAVAGQPEQTVLVHHILHILAAPAGIQEAGRAAGDIGAALEQAGLAADHIFALIGGAVALKVVGLAGDALITGQDLTGNGILVRLGAFIEEHSVEGRKRRGEGTIPAADGIFIHQDILMLLAELLLFGIAVKLLAAALEAPDGDRGLVRLHRQIDGGVVVDQTSKVEVGIVGHGIGLLARGAGNEVDDTLLVVHCAIGHGQGPRIGVVMTGEHEINARCLRRCGEHIMDLVVAAGGIGEVGRLMDGQDLPRRIGLCSILLQPFQSSGQLLAVGGVVDHGHIHVVIHHGVVSAVAGGRQVVDLRGPVSRCIAGKLVVAEDMDHIGVTQCVGPDQVNDPHPVGIAGGVIHRIAGLNAEIKVACVELGDDARDLRQILRLDITQDEELHRSVTVIGFQGVLLGPLLAVTHAIHIYRVGGKTGDLRTVDADHGVSALGEGDAGADSVDGGPLAAAGHLVLQGLRRGLGVREPGHVAFQATDLGGVIHNAEGRTAFVTLGIEAGDGAGEGETTLRILGIDDSVRRRTAQEVCGQGPVLVR